MSDRLSLRSAINRFCAACIYDPAGDGGKAQQIAACTAKNCPLYSVRPTPREGTGPHPNFGFQSEIYSVTLQNLASGRAA